MIARIWKGVTAVDDAERYYRYLRDTGLKEYKATEGNKGVRVLQRIDGNKAEFILISFWESLDAIKKFAGEKYEAAVFYPEDERFLVEKDLRVEHYSVLQ